MYSRTLYWNSFLSFKYCSAASLLSGSSKLSKSCKYRNHCFFYYKIEFIKLFYINGFSIISLTVYNEFRPQITSFSVLIGVHPKPSIALCRSSDKQISPFTEMFGCQSIVWHFTFGGCNTCKLCYNLLNRQFLNKNPKINEYFYSPSYCILPARQR